MESNKLTISTANDFFDSLTGTATAPLHALAELIWNGFDACANNVSVNIDFNDLGVMTEIRIRDNGKGIPYDNIKELFGSLGGSWKKNAQRDGDRVLHGKSGKGRFKAFTLGHVATWETVYCANSELWSYSITGKKETPRIVEYTEPTKGGKHTGTEVIISDLHRVFTCLDREGTNFDLAKMFAVYLTEYPDISLEYNDEPICPDLVQDRKCDFLLEPVVLENGDKTDVSITIIEWKNDTERRIYLCDSKGTTYHDYKPNRAIRAPGFDFTVHVKSDYIRELDQNNMLGAEELGGDLKLIMTPVLEKVKSYFRDRELENKGQIIEEWKKENIYPYEDSSDIGPLELAERQVFDIVAVNVQSHLQSFSNAENHVKKFTFRLLSQAIKENPASLEKIITEVLGLRKEDQDIFAELLDKTSLSSIISLSKIVADRLDFLHGFEKLIFDQETKGKMLERDQIHKMLESEVWIFREEFVLAGSDERLETVLRKHRKHIDGIDDEFKIDQPVHLPSGKTGRIDLFLSKACQPRPGEYDYLVVELKRPSQKIDAKALVQIENYAIAVASDERFATIDPAFKYRNYAA